MSGRDALVRHEGRVTAVGAETVTVEIAGRPACSGCHARGGCALSGEERKIIEIPLDIRLLADLIREGDTVTLVLKPSLGLKAVWLAYVIPLALLLAAILAGALAGIPEIYTGLSALGIVFFYYLVLSLFKGRLSKEFTFSIER